MIGRLISRRMALGGMIVIAGAVAGQLSAIPSYAHITTCRSDPLVVLSDGTQLALTADIGTAEANVQRIAYTLHVPNGVSVRHVQFTQGGLGGREWFQVSADQAPWTYASDTVVYTHPHPVAVQASTTAKNLVHGVAAGSASGTDGQHLAVHVSDH